LAVLFLLILFWLSFSQRYYLSNLYRHWQVTRIPARQHQEINYQGGDESVATEDRVEKEVIPKSLNLSVPFTPQAPFANWSLPYKESCEEASLLMVYYFFQDKSLTPDLARVEIDDLVAWQLSNYGSHRDLSARETGELARAYWGVDFEVVEDLTVDKIMSYLSVGYPVIVPAVGRELNNPHFRQPGPLYHMLVIKGYTKDKFITNDPGTRYGADYLYAKEELLAAVHDWTGERPDGHKIGLIIKQP
jgi:hypothetical protein